MAAWTEERRQKQRELIKKLKPWEKSTGPRSKGGKRRSSQNAVKHGVHARSRKNLKRLIRYNLKFATRMTDLALETFQEIEENELLKKRRKIR